MLLRYISDIMHVIKKIRSKKGFAIQFSWLFVLIGGAIILAFFFALIKDYSHGSEVESFSDLTKELDELFSVSLASRDTQKTIFFDEKINFACDDVSSFYVEGSDVHRDYDYDVIFSPTELQGEELIVKTLVFEAPFRVTPMLYLSNKDIEFVFSGSSTVINLVYGFMPENLTLRSTADIKSYPNNDFFHTVFVVNDSSLLTTLNNFRKSDGRAYAVVIASGEGTLLEYGNLSFYHYEPSGFVYDGTSPFLGQETLVAGVLSHDWKLYDCNLNKLLQRLELLSGLHIERVKHYYEHVPFVVCKQNYDGQPESARNHLEDIKSSSGEEPSIDKFMILNAAITDLRNLNNYLITTECPRLY